MQYCHEVEEWRLLGCYAVWLLSEPTFRRNLAFFIRVTRIGELGTTQAATCNRRTLRRSISSQRTSVASCLMKEAPSSSETSVLTRATRRNNREDTILPWSYLRKFNYTKIIKNFDNILRRYLTMRATNEMRHTGVDKKARRSIWMLLKCRRITGSLQPPGPLV
jgi:hypothetical protein